MSMPGLDECGVGVWMGELVCSLLDGWVNNWEMDGWVIM